MWLAWMTFGILPKCTYLEHVQHDDSCNTVVPTSSHDCQARDKHAGAHAQTAEDEELATADLVKNEPGRV